MAALGLGAVPAAAASLYFGPNAPMQYDFGDLARLPAGFGEGEFTFEIWIKPDPRFPVGDTFRGTRDQLAAWSAADPQPYSSPGWWLPGNWLIDGHSRPEGFGPGASRAGTFSLQFHGGGRLRWMFSDGCGAAPAGMVYAVQAWPAATTASLLDGRWHHVAAVRRWTEPEGAALELWIDGARIAETRIPCRVNMRRFWDRPPHPDNPPGLGGWAFGSEVMTAWDRYFTQYEDYKGWVDELRFRARALRAEEIAAAASGRPAQALPGLVGHIPLDEGRGPRACDAMDRDICITLHRSTAETWSIENAPIGGLTPAARAAPATSPR